MWITSVSGCELDAPNLCEREKPEEGEIQKEKKKKQQPKIILNERFSRRFTVMFLLFLDYTKLEACVFCAGGIFRKKMKD